MSTDFENELRDLLREKAGEAPVATPAAAPQQVLRRGRRRQATTILGSAAVTLILIVGSVAGLQRILGDRPDPFQAGDYEVFDRTATIEAFTVTSPSDWYLVNQWPLSMLIAVEGSSGAASSCVAVPGNDNQGCERTPGVETSSPILVPHGLPMLQLSNEDIGLEFIACGGELPSDMAVLYVAIDYERAIAGIADPSIQPFPPEPGRLSGGDGPCGPGRYAHFSVNGEPFFAWVGVGESVSDADRSTVMAAYDSIVVDDTWEPVPPGESTPAYVIAGGTTDAGDDWRLELRPSTDNVKLSLPGFEPGAEDFTFVDQPIVWCCGHDEGFSVVTFGAISKAVTRVEFQPADGRPSIPGRIVPLPPSLLFDFDLFFIEGTEGLAGHVVVVDDDGTVTPTPVAEPRGDVVELSGTFLEQPWTARFTGNFADGSACIRVTIDEAFEPLCQRLPEAPLMGAKPSMHGWATSKMNLLAGSVPPAVTEIRFVGNDDAVVPTSFQCETGPLGWTDPDVKVCVLLLPPSGSGTIQYLDVGGTAVFEEGMGWGVSEPEVAPMPVDPVQGGTYWAAYAWLGSGAEETQIERVQQQLLEDHGVRGLRGSLMCDEGAAEALATSADHKVAVYFETQQDANAFALRAGLLGHEASPVVARVTIVCIE